jgi:hypothetical protein
LRGNRVLHGRREKWVLHAAALHGPQREKRVLNTAAELGLQCTQREKRVLNAAAKLGLQSRSR